MSTLHAPVPTTPEGQFIELYAALQEIQREQKRQAESIEKTLSAMCRKCDIEDKRIGLLEKWRAAVTGGLVVIATLAGVAFGHALKLWVP